MYDGYEIYNGYIRLNAVDINGLEKIYSITFYNGVGDVAANIGDKFLRQLDLSSLSHPMNPSVYLDSQLDPNLFNLTGSTEYAYQDGRTFFGLFNIGYNYTESSSGLTQFYAGVGTGSNSIDGGVKSLTTNPTDLPYRAGDTIRFTYDAENWVQGVVSSYNKTTGGLIMNANLALGTGTFSSWVLSYELPEGTIINDPQTTPLLDFAEDGVPNYMSFSGTPVKQYYFKPAIQVKELYTQIFNQAGYSVDSEFFNTSYFEKFYLPLKFLDETIYTKGTTLPCYSFNGNQLYYQDPYYLASQVDNTTCNNVPFSNFITDFTIPASYGGIYTFKITTEYSLTTDGITDAYLNGFMFFNGSPYPVFNGFKNSTPAGTQVYTNVSYVKYNVITDTIIKLAYTFNNYPSFFTYKFEIVDGPPVIIGDFDYANEFPENDYKQIDFITSINKMFNFVCVAHPTKTDTIIVEPIVNYIGKGEILDWTDKVNFDNRINISPTANLLNGTLNFNFKLDKDYGNQQFNISSNKIFGTYKLQLNQDFKDKIISFDTMFGSPTDIALSNNSGDRLTIQNMAAIKNENINGKPFQKYNPFKILPRIVFRGPVIPNENWGLTTGNPQEWYLEQYPQDRWQEVSRFTTYPFSYSGFSHYLNWEAQDVVNTDETIFPEQDLYDIYYYDYVSDIISDENKLVKAQMYLTPWEIANLRFDEKILIKNSYFRINKISNFNLLKPDLCDVELVKLTKDYTPVPTLYYDLISCTGGTNYHSTSNLNYNLYAYVGNYVKLYSNDSNGVSLGCYRVELGEPNADYDYDQFYIEYGYTSSGVAVYDNCGCTQRTGFDIVQQR